jgi:hypothetical protein
MNNIDVSKNLPAEQLTNERHSVFHSGIVARYAAETDENHPEIVRSILEYYNH